MIENLPVVKASEEDKVIRNFGQSVVNLKPSEVSKKTLTPVADSI